MYWLLAHGEDLHDATTSNLEHQLTQPYIALPLFIGFLLLLYSVLHTAFEVPKSQIALIFMAIFLVSGVLLYSLVPIVSIISLTLGVILSLFFALSAIAK